jgi:excisionase family DNA binding protein
MPSSQVKDEEVSPQEAAEMLRMSRPSVMRLIQQGHLHSRKVLSRNRLSRAEVLAFQKRNARQQQQALEDLSVLSQEYDF